MKNNDLSNHSAPILAFNVDTLLFTKAEEGRIQNLINKVRTDKELYFRQDLNTLMGYRLNNIWLKHNARIYLITAKPFLEELDEYIRDQDVYFTKIVKYDSIEDLRVRVQNNFMYYFDSDTSMLSRLSCKNALHIDDITTVL